MSDTADTAGFVDPNFPNPEGPNDARLIIYGYTPNFVLCVLAIVLFALSFFFHAYQVGRYRTWYYTPLSVACAMEVIGYIFRALSSRKDPYHIIYFIIQYFCIVVAPVFISASIYVCLTKLITWASHHGFDTRSKRWLSPKGILYGFISCDVVTTIIQVAGAALIGKAESDRKNPDTANDILLAGLAIQAFAFLIFLTLFGVFQISLYRDPTFDAGSGSRGAKQQFFFAIASASLLVFLRTIFRLAETSQGVFGYLSSHEVFFGVLEFMPVVIAVWILGIWHPGRWLRHERTHSSLEPGGETTAIEKVPS